MPEFNSKRERFPDQHQIPFNNIENLESDSDIIASLLDDASLIFLKKLSRNDRSWADGRSHQNGVLIPKEVRDTDFFSPFIPNTDVRFSDVRFSIYWPESDVSTESRYIYYKSKNEYRLTRIPKEEFAGLSPGSFLLISKHRREGTYIWKAITIDSLSEEYDYIERRLELPIDFLWKIIDPRLLQERITPEIEEIFSEIFSAVENGTLANLIEIYKLPSTNEIAKEAREEYLISTDNASLNPFVISNPGDALREITKHRQFEIFKKYERRLIAAKLIDLLINDRANITIEKLVSIIITRIYDVYEVMLRASQARRSRVGRSFEDHIAVMMKDGDVPFTEQPIIGKRRPDFALPRIRFSVGQSLILTAKTTLRERWQQVINETKGRPIYLATVDDRVTSSVIEDLGSAGVYLVVPEALKFSEDTEYRRYPHVLTFTDFFNNTKQTYQPIWLSKGISCFGMKAPRFSG